MAYRCRCQRLKGGSQSNLKRNKTDVELSDVKRLIRNELDGPGSISGYRGIWHTLRVMYGLYIPGLEVAYLLRRLDPAGVVERKRHKLKRRKYNSPGSNYCCPVGGNDKLKPFGFPIRGAGDGYSRRVIWWSQICVMVNIQLDCLMVTITIFDLLVGKIILLIGW